MAAEGMSAEEIAQGVNGHRTLTEAKLGLIELLTSHASAGGQRPFLASGASEELRQERARGIQPPSTSL